MKIIDMNRCSGCTACMNVCPKECIKMESNSEGFLYPEINSEKCINCGLCKKVCPIYKAKKHSPVSVYAVKNKDDEVRLNSTSGGVFTAISDYVIDNNGVVVGCKFNENMEAVHDFATTKEQITAFRGAKYVQSILGDTFKKVKSFLQKEKIVFFTGTPCQVAGLKAYLEKDYENLIMCDLVCHSVPSIKALKTYLKEFEDKYSSKVNKFYLREKELNGWQKSNIKVVFENGDIHKEILRDSPFMIGFNDGLYSRLSCSDCAYKDFKGSSDITIGDYWGIDLVNKDFSDNLGVSLVFINSDKGVALFDKIKANLTFVETELEDSVMKNPYVITSSKAHKNRDVFFENIDTENFSDLVKKLLK